MKKTPSREDKLSDAFFVLGSEYYATALFLAEESSMFICATLFHHAIEMILKGCLIRNHSLSELRNVGHKLTVLWEMYKSTVNSDFGPQLDRAISQINKLEILRYPDSIVDDGFELHTRIGPPTQAWLSGAGNNPHYFVDVLVLEEIVLSIYNLCEVNPTPYFRNVPIEFKNTLHPNFFLPDEELVTGTNHT